MVLATQTVTVDPLLAYQLRPPALLEDGAALLPIAGPVGGMVALDRSSNLTDWIRLATVEQTDAVTLFSDASATNAPIRFYRLQQL